MMPNIKPVSDLRNYSEVLMDVEEGSPVFLTKNGRGKYVVMDIKDYERERAIHRLMRELEKGRRSAREEKLLTAEEMREHFRKRVSETA